MKNILPLFFALIISVCSFAQVKKPITKQGLIKPVRIFAAPSTVSIVSDVSKEDNLYETLRSLIDDHKVVIYYQDNKFYGKENLKRGDFIVHFNSALESIKRYMDSLGHDTSLINTYDRNRSYITGVEEIKDLKPGSLYYPAVKSMLEQWGIAAMFKKDKLLNANGTLTEAEVYDILHVTIGYDNAAVSKRTLAIKRAAFAVMLNDAIMQVRQRIIRLPKRQPDVVRDTFYIQQPFDTTKKR